MNLCSGIIGLPNVGKSTFFNALVKISRALASNFPFCTIDPNIGIVPVPNENLQRIASLSKSKKILPATTTFVDIAGIVKGASKGEGLGNQFLSNIREADSLLHVVRCFEDPEVVHVDGTINPINDIEVVELELVLADLQMAEKALEKIKKQTKSRSSMPASYDALEKIFSHFQEGFPFDTCALTLEEKETLQGYPFLSGKKVIYVANISENELQNYEESPYYRAVAAHAKKRNAEVIPICASLEQELLQLNQQEASAYLQSFGLEKSGLDRLISLSFSTLGLITFLTTGEQETRAWTITQGTMAKQAAGKIHTDIEKGFIKAEVISCDDFLTHQGRLGAKEAGKMRLEGKDYIVQDQDIMLFFHH